jgi:hypothetical protein
MHKPFVQTKYWDGPQVSLVDAIYSKDCSKQWEQRRKGMQSYWKTGTGSGKLVG